MYYYVLLCIKAHRAGDPLCSCQIRAAFENNPGRPNEFIWQIYTVPFLKAGRTVNIKKNSDDFGWGIIVNYKKETKSRLETEEASDESASYINVLKPMYYYVCMYYVCIIYVLFLCIIYVLRPIEPMIMITDPWAAFRHLY